MIRLDKIEGLQLEIAKTDEYEKLRMLSDYNMLSAGIAEIDKEIAGLFSDNRQSYT